MKLFWGFFCLVCAVILVFILSKSMRASAPPLPVIKEDYWEIREVYLADGTHCMFVINFHQRSTGIFPTCNWQEIRTKPTQKRGH